MGPLVKLKLREQSDFNGLFELRKKKTEKKELHPMCQCPLNTNKKP